MPVYFIREGGAGFIKIGKGYGGERCYALQTGTPWRLEVLKEIEGSHRDEWVLHQIFRRDRIHSRREWFRPSEELLRFIDMEDKLIYNVINKMKPILEADSTKNIILNFPDDTKEELQSRVEKYSSKE